MEGKIKLVVTVDQEVMRKALKSLLRENGSFEVIGEAGNGKELLNLLKKIHPDIILLDLEMPVMNGKEALGKIVKYYPDIKVIIFSLHNELTLMSELIIAGAKAFIPKNSSLMEFTDVVMEVYEKGSFVNAKLMEAVINRSVNGSNEYILSKYAISKREAEILIELCKGKKENEIAELLSISRNTVHTHRVNLYSKTRTHNIAGLIIYAQQNGLI